MERNPSAAQPLERPDLSKSGVGVVVIGRNEGARLVICLRSVLGRGLPVVYVDSGSSDGSPQRARDLGADVVELDPSRPFTAARGRNEGAARLREGAGGVGGAGNIELLQFLDGDTEVIDGWLDAAVAAMQDETVAAVCGRRRERHPERSVYNRLCDIEWNTPPGETRVFGGDVMIRARDFFAAGGYDADLIAGEDPDLAVRLAKLGNKRILRLDVDMTWHDAALTRFSQWWKRALRGGHAFAEGAERHGADGGFWVKEVRSNWAWGAALPALGALAFAPTLGASAVVVAGGYGALFAKVRRDAKRRGFSDDDAVAYAAFTTLAKLPQAAGQAKYWWGRVRHKRSRIIEYK